MVATHFRPDVSDALRIISNAQCVYYVAVSVRV